MGMYCQVSVAGAGDLDQFSAEENVLTAMLPGRASGRPGVSLEKAWHGLHYLLTGKEWEGQGPRAFLLAGGEQLGEDEESPLRWFSPEEVKDIQRELSGISDDELWSRFDADEMEQKSIYPGIWDEAEEDLKEEYLGYFNELKGIVATAAESDQGLLVSLG